MGIINPRGIMPETLMHAERRADALRWIMLAPYGASMKLGLLRGWAASVGLTLTAEEYRAARASSLPTKPVEVKREQ
jgi:hypothetical protein